jgi:two-component system, LytTR family, response regulator
MMPGQQPPSVAQFWIGGSLVLWLVYTVVIAAALAQPMTASALDALASVLPMAALAALVHAVLKSVIMPRRFAVQAVAHAGLAFAFAITWYALVVVLLAFFSGLRGQGYGIMAFSRSAFSWQMFQGLMLYATTASVCYALRGGRMAANVTIVPNAPMLHRYLTRAGDGILPIDVRNIVSITGAQDYAEVRTRDGACHLVRMSLQEFERRLDPQCFLRVHRSTIINFDLLAKVEPAGGGRALVHMTDGETLTTSRSGYQSLRALMV